MEAYESKHEARRDTHEDKYDKQKKHTTRCECENECPDVPQTHDHEFLGSTKLAEEEEERHNHRFAGVTTEMIPCGEHHIHAFMTNTDFFDHHHEIGGTTGIEIPVGNGKHVHFASGTSTCDDGHAHDFQFATLIDSPLLPLV
jgi:hypothetical protein